MKTNTLVQRLAGMVVVAALVAAGCDAGEHGEGRAAEPSAVRSAVTATPRPVASVGLSAAAVSGGGTVVGTVTLAGSDGTTAVTLSADSDAADVPASIQVPSGTATGAFTIVTHPVTAPVTVRITAQAAGASAFADVQVLPATATTSASAIVDDPGCQANALARNDDSSTGAVTLPSPLNFFGTTYTFFYINNNGNVTFRQPQATYTPFTITASTPPIIAPFFADVDTRGSGSSPVTYSFGPVQFGGRPAMCVNWVNVGYYSSHFDKLNSFQLLLVDRSDVNPNDFDIVMNYDHITWETGDASGGLNGFGGTPAGAGYSAGSGVASQFYQFPGSLTAGALLDSNAATGLSRTSRNTLVAGRHIFEVRNGAAPAGGAIAGTVTDAATPPNALAGAPVQVCGVVDGHCVYLTLTGATGQYEATGIAEGDYLVTVFPPAGSSLFSRTVGPVHVSAGTVQQVNVVLSGPTPPPPGVTLTPSRGSQGGLPVLYWQTPIELRAGACAGAQASYAITSPAGATFASGPMSEIAPGTYSAIVPPFYPNHGPAHVHIHTTCPSDIDFDIYIDPSGAVRTVAGAPVVGALVTLFRSDSAAGPFEAVPDGSAVMSPMNRHNPDTSDTVGHFGWDVISGFYKVRAQADGCTSPAGGPYVETDVLTIPPAITGLDLRLLCATADTTPPITTAAVSPSPNAAGWYSTAPVVALSALDEPAGSGVASLQYVTTGAQAGGATVAGNAAQFTVAADGVTTLTFAATDVAGNAEPPHTLSFNVDRAPPTVTCPAAVISVASATGALVPVSIAVAGSDAGSGLASLVLTALQSSVPLADGDQQGFLTGQPPADGLLRAAPAGRTYDLTYTAVDVAGNSAACVAHVQVQPATGTTDTTPPACKVSRLLTTGGGRTVELTLTDTDSGLARVRVVTALGAAVVVPRFTAGVKTPVVARASAPASSDQMSVVLETTDQAGNVARCGASLLRLSPRSHQPSLAGVPDSEATLTVYDGTPGLRTARASVNGHALLLDHLQEGRARSFDISGLMQAGSVNRVALDVDCGARGSADVLLWQGAGQTPPPRL